MCVQIHSRSAAAHAERLLGGCVSPFPGARGAENAMREVHPGGRLDAGIVRWSAETQRASTRLTTRQAADAASTFLTATA